MAVRIHLRWTYTVYSLYLAPGVPIARDDLVELLRQLPEPFLLIGDFNIRFPSWGDKVASPNAAILLSATSDFSLCCLNFGLPTHYHSFTDSFSCIELSFALPQLFFTSPSLVILIRFFCPSLILLQFLLVPLVGTPIVQIGLGFPWPPKFVHLFSHLHP